jgi:hypothetical protein
MVGPLSNIACAGGYAALPGNGIQVFPIAGAAPVTLAGLDPRYEPGVSQPHLLARLWSESEPSKSGIALAATDGTVTTTLAIAGYVVFHTWLGSAAVYGTTPDSTEHVTIRALSQAGAIDTLLADQIGTYAWAPVAAPKRLFYSRPQANSGGPAGVFYADLPR